MLERKQNSFKCLLITTMCFYYEDASTCTLGTFWDFISRVPSSGSEIYYVFSKW